MFIEIFNVELGLIETMSRKRRTVFNLLNSIVEQRKRILEESGALEFRSQLNQDRNFEATFGRNTGLWKREPMKVSEAQDEREVA